MKSIHILGAAACLATLALALTLPAQADGRHHGPQWHGDIHRFHDRDIHVWRGGRWHHGHHGGRYGWWWVVAGTWYFYTDPVYPYPDPYQPPVAVPVPQSPAVPSPVAAPSAPVWYYCPSAKGYYPYVSVCPGGWKTVPATPPGE